MKKYLFLLPIILVIPLLLVLQNMYQRQFSINTKAQESQFAVYEEPKLVIKPILVGESVPPELTAVSVQVFDISSSTVLFEKNPNQKLYPASTAKVLTGLVSLDAYELDQALTVKNIKTEGQMMDLVDGEQINVGSLLYGLLMYSANDAAEVLAVNYPGGRDLFIEAMNVKAKELGMNNSHFKNPTGLDDQNQYTTASDMVKIALAAMDNSFFAEVVSTNKAFVKSVDGEIIHNLTNINELLGSVEGVLGIKTGWTQNAKENLVTFVVRDKARVIITLLGSEDRFGETTQVIDWVFDNYQWQESY